MKRLPAKLQRLSERAAEIRQTIQSVPPIISELHNTVAATTASVQKLRADVISSVASLRAETDGQLLATMKEIDGAAEILAEAGCQIERVDLDLGPVRRLVVHLERAEDIVADDVRALHARQSDRPAIQALLRAIIKADELADSVELSQLRPTRLTVEIGLIPTVRIGWSAASSEDEAESGASIPSADAALPSPRAAPPATAASDVAPSQSAFFQRRPSQPDTTTVNPSEEEQRYAVESPAVDVAPRRAPDSATEPNKTDDWRRGALDRFKKMPDLRRLSL